MSRTLAIVLLIPFLHVLVDRTTLADPPPVIADFEDFLVIEPVGKGGRSPVHTDAIEAAIVDGSWATPEGGDAVRVGRIPRIWQSATAGETAAGVARTSAIAGKTAAVASTGTARSRGRKRRRICSVERTQMLPKRKRRAPR